jgi:hypothetical protein
LIIASFLDQFEDFEGFLVGTRNVNDDIDMAGLKNR